MRTIASGCHVAHVDDMTGVGMLVCPAPESDLPIGGETSLGLYEADWNSITDRLHQEGRGLLEDDGMPVEEGITVDGLAVLSLYGLRPIIDSPAFEQIADAHRELSREVGLA